MNIFKAEINNNFDSHVLLHDGLLKWCITTVMRRHCLQCSVPKRREWTGGRLPWEFRCQKERADVGMDCGRKVNC